MTTIVSTGMHTIQYKKKLIWIFGLISLDCF